MKSKLIVTPRTIFSINHTYRKRFGNAERLRNGACVENIMGGRPLPREHLLRIGPKWLTGFTNFLAYGIFVEFHA